MSFKFEVSVYLHLDYELPCGLLLILSKWHIDREDAVLKENTIEGREEGVCVHTYCTLYISKFRNFG
jgi:hypothetical protein